jgi:hypothetical protein
MMRAQDCMLVVFSAFALELVARRAGVARSPPRAMACSWIPIAASTRRTVLKFGSDWRRYNEDGGLRLVGRPC